MGSKQEISLKTFIGHILGPRHGTGDKTGDNPNRKTSLFPWRTWVWWADDFHAKNILTKMSKMGLRLGLGVKLRREPTQGCSWGKVFLKWVNLFLSPKQNIYSKVKITIKYRGALRTRVPCDPPCTGQSRLTGNAAPGSGPMPSSCSAIRTRQQRCSPVMRSCHRPSPMTGGTFWVSRKFFLQTLGSRVHSFWPSTNTCFWGGKNESKIPGDILLLWPHPTVISSTQRNQEHWVSICFEPPVV